MVFYTVKELSKLLKVSTRTVIQLIIDKKLRAFKIGREWRITPDDLNEYLKQITNK